MSFFRKKHGNGALTQQFWTPKFISPEASSSLSSRFSIPGSWTMCRSICFHVSKQQFAIPSIIISISIINHHLDTIHPIFSLTRPPQSCRTANNSWGIVMFPWLPSSSANPPAVGSPADGLQRLRSGEPIWS